MGENILNDSFCQFSGALILFLHNLDKGSRSDMSAVSSIHLHDQWAAIPLSSVISMPTSITQLSTDFQVKIDDFFERTKIL